MTDLRVNFCSDVYLMVEAMKAEGEVGDKRNLKAAELLEKSACIYLHGGDQYKDLLEDIIENIYLEYSDWYKKKILGPYLDNPIETPTANNYEFNKYFDGLNKDAFEEMQRMIMFLMDDDSTSVIESMAGDEDTPEIGYETRNFAVAAYPILVACLEGDKYLKKIEKLFKKHKISEEKIESFKKTINDSRIIDLAEGVLRFHKKKIK